MGAAKLSTCSERIQGGAEQERQMNDALLRERARGSAGGSVARAEGCGGGGGGSTHPVRAAQHRRTDPRGELVVKVDSARHDLQRGPAAVAAARESASGPIRQAGHTPGARGVSALCSRTVR